MDAATRQSVWQQAGGRCEYCRISQEQEPGQAFHIEHITALQHRGDDELENLALACCRCNAYKGPNFTSRDPDTDRVELLFNPRAQAWEEHLRMDGHLILGITPVGRTTAWLLQMNAPGRVAIRAFWAQIGDDL